MNRNVRRKSGRGIIIVSLENIFAEEMMSLIPLAVPTGDFGDTEDFGIAGKYAIAKVRIS